MNRALLLCAVMWSAAAQLPAQSIQLSGPVEGFTFDRPTGGFRPVIGFPGSASFRDSNAGGYERGSVAPRKDYGLGFRDGQWEVVTGLGADSASTSPVSDIHADAEGIAWSGDGSLAVFFSRSANWIQTLAAVPFGAVAAAPIDLSILPGAMTAVAADASGKRIAVGMAGEAGGVYLITDGGSPSPLFAGSKPVALAFSDDGSELYSVDAESAEVSVFQLSNFTIRSFPLEGVKDPVAVKSKRDLANRKILLVAGRQDSLLRIYDANSFEIVADLALDFEPSELADFGRNSVLLGARSSAAAPLWLFTTTPSQNVYFVPAPAAAPGGSQ